MDTSISALAIDKCTLVDLLSWRASNQPDQRAYTFLVDGETEEVHLTYKELDRWARAIALMLQNLGVTGERALLLYPPGLEYIATFFGCLYAGVVAVPAYPPQPNRPVSRLQAIVADAQATVVLTSTQILSNAKRLFAHAPELEALHWLATDDLEGGEVGSWQEHAVTRETLAFLQYTSGSTAAPKGVMLTHGNLLHNASLMYRHFEITSESRGVSWLPLYHDMGLIGMVLQAIYAGGETTIMSPVAFLQRPIRWLQAISSTRATISGGPNFAYDLCVRKITSEHKATLDLSSWKMAFNGAEPVRQETMERFAEAFAPCGFHWEAFHPCYGLAEATLLVSGGRKVDGPVVRTLQKAALEQNQIVMAEASIEHESSRTFVGCGKTLLGQKIVIVNPESLTQCLPDQIGEIWVSGPSIAQGYWQQLEESERTFQAHLSDTGEGPFLRTGDLGFLQDGELFISGRLKDLIIIRGRNHYPEDIELTVEQSHPALRPGCGVAFSVDALGEERLVIVQEVERQYRDLNVDGVVGSIRQAVAEQHELQVYAVVLVKIGTIPKTSSGKLQRRACREAFLAGTLDVLGEWTLSPEESKIETSGEPPAATLAGRQVSQAKTAEAIQAWLVSHISERLKVDPQNIDVREPLVHYGLDSVQAVGLAEELGSWLACQLPPTLAYDYPSIESLARYLVEGPYASKTEACGSTRLEVTTEPIAIIGLGCRFPGAKNHEAFWQLLRNGVDAITEVPTDRWHTGIFHDVNPLTPDKLGTRWGGFLEQVDQFDPQFFGISPREAARMDPQQRLLLEVTWEALEDAGHAPDQLAGSQTGVFNGISSSDYARFQFGTLDRVDAYAGTGSALSIAANRLSYLLDLKGPSLAIDTACSSSLVAVHLACQSLLLGESNLALAGGVNLILLPDLTAAFSQARMIASDGRCKTFDAAADGYVRGEGCGVVVLKRLSDALKDGDHIWALVHGSAVNQDGRSNGLTAPHGPAQQAVILQALSRARISPAQIGYVEAHGTGTSLGDPIEVQALGNVLREGRPKGKACAVGSVKTNIGHLEAAAGIAGLIKAVLCLMHGEIPPHLHLKNLNPYIPLDELPIVIPTERQPWPAGAQPHFAGVSSFGFGGTNAHVILAEAPAITPVDAECERPLHMLSASAQSEDALKELASRYAKHLAAHPEQQIQNICYTANTGRTHFSHRLAVMASSSEQLEKQLHAFATGEQAIRLQSGHVQGRNRPRVAFLFTGQGPQYPGMGRHLYETQSIFRSALNQCDEILSAYLERSLLSVLYTTPGRSALLHETVYAQPALFALEYALTQLWRSWGIEPDVVLGHSLGEYVAACVAGVFNLEDGLKLIAERGRLMQSLPKVGRMAAVFADEMIVGAALIPFQEQVSIAAVNGPKNTVIAGAEQALQAVLHHLESEGVTTQLLQASHAFHSPLMEPILDAFEQRAHDVRFEAPHLPFVSSLTGRVLTAGEVPNAAYWRRHIREAVRFTVGMHTLAEQGYDVYIELGPHPSLLAMGKKCIAKNTGLWLPSLKEGHDDWQVMLESLGAFYVRGGNIDWAGFDKDYQRNRVSLPTYPFEHKRYWIGSSEAVSYKEEMFREGGPQAGQEDQFSSSGKSEFTPMNEQREVVLSKQPASMQSTPRRRDTILSILRTTVSGLLQLDPVALDVSTPFLEMGADSIVLIEAIQTIEKTFGVKLSIRQMFEEFTTLDALATCVDAGLAQDVVLADPRHIVPQAHIEQAMNSTSTARSADVHLVSETLEREASASIPEPATTALERIMAKQLDTLSALMTQQLEILRENPLFTEKLPASQVTSLDSSHRPIPLAHASTSPSRHDQHADTTVSEAPSDTVRTDTNAVAPLVSYQAVRSGEELNPQQQRHIEALIARYTRRTQRSKQLTQAYRPILSDNRASAGFRFSIKEMLYPIIAERSMGSHIWDVDGNVYVDLSMGFGVNLFGHGAPFIMEALEEQLKRGIQLGPQTHLAGEVAALIHELTGVERVTFCNSGTEAVMTALRLARAATGRAKIALFAGSYHGSFDGVLARAQAAEGHLHAVPVAPGIPQQMVEDVLVLEYGSPQALEMIQAHANELAAVLVEPVQSRRPDLQPKAFLQRLRRQTEDAGIALIYDEVITGFRIHPGGAQAWFGMKADVVTYGKIVGGGMPIGVVAGKSSYLDGIDGGVWTYGDASYPRAETTFFAGTFCKHPLAMAAARAVLQQIKQHGPALQEQLNQRTAQFAETLNTFFTERSVPIRVVYFGSLFRFAFSGNMDLLFYHLLEKGVYIWEGRNCFLSTAHTDEDIAHVVRAVKQSVEELQAAGFLPERPSGSAAVEKQPGEASNSLTDYPSATLPAHPTDDGETGRDQMHTIALSEDQRQLWTLAQIGAEGLSACNEFLLELRGPLDVAALHRAFQQVVGRHEALRTTISAAGDVQHIAATLTLPMPIIDFSTLDTPERAAKQAQWLKQEHQRGFDLTQGPLVRTHILKLEEQRHLLVLATHHIVVDGWSANVLLQEVSALYSVALQGSSCQLAPPMQFRDYVQWQVRQSQSAQAAVDESYWLEQFAGSIPGLELPTDHRRPPIKTYKGARLSMRIDASLLSELKRLSRRQGCTPFMTLLAGYLLLLHRLTGQDNVIVGIPSAGQALVDGGPLVGDCVNLLPIRSRLAGNPTFAGYLATMKHVVLGAYDHQAYPFATLIKKLKPPRDTSRSPLVTAAFNMDRPLAVAKIGELEAKVVPAVISHVLFDVSLNISEISSGLLVDFDYNTDLFEAATISRMQGHFQTLLESIVAHPEQHVSTLSLLTEAEYRQLREWNDTFAECPEQSTIHELFEAQVERTPEALSVIFEDKHLTYQDLNQCANQLAHYLQKSGVGPEVRVGICMERSIEMIVGLLGILKAGGAYVPLDPTYPAKRLAFMLQDAQVPVLLTQQRLVEGLPEHQAEVVCLDTDWLAISKESKMNATSDVTLENLVYVIYTSGSTGKPKGAMNTHQAICNRLLWMQEQYQLHDQDRVLQKTPFSFDVSVWEFFWPLITGARLVIARPEGHKDASYLVDMITREEISTIHFVPSLLQIFLEEPGVERCTSLQRVICSGEALSYDLQERFFERSRAALHNLYGPTEAAVDVTSWTCERGNARRSVPIGRPVANTQIYILDQQLQPVPIGVAGELHIGGVQVGRGYLNRLELTAERFIPHPFSDVPGARLYQTGDLARYLPDGSIEFVGRIDQQVKVRGFRIELGEIEVVLGQHPAVRESVVIVREVVPGDKRPVAYLVTEQTQPEGLSISELRNYVRERLPEYMIPAAFVVLEALPLNSNGKVDREALPAPDIARTALETAYLAPRSPVEEVLTGIWSEILQIEQVGIHDNFFELGGDSILSIQLVARAKQAGLQLTPKQVFQYQTIAELAAVVGTAAPIRAEQGEVTGSLPLTPIQHWFFEQALPEVHHWNQAVLLQVQREMKVAWLQAAVEYLVGHHDALRLQFEQTEAGWQQRNAEREEGQVFSHIDLSQVEEGEQVLALERAVAELQTSLNLTKGPLLRVAFFEMGARGCRLLFIIHHLAVDGVSWRILLEDLQSAYEQLSRGEAVELPPKTTSYQQWAQQLKEYALCSALQTERDYWLAGCRHRIARLPLDYGAGENTVASAGNVVVEFSATQTQALLHEVPKAYHTQINEVLLTALVQATMQWTGEPALLVDVEGHGREDIFGEVDLSRTVGWFTTIFPVVLDVGEARGPGDALKLVKEQLRAVPNKGIGYGVLRYLSEEAGLQEQLKGMPQAEISFNYLGQFDQIVGQGTLCEPAQEASGPSHSQQAVRQHVVEISGGITRGQLQLVWTYSAHLHKRTTIERLAQHYNEALCVLIAHCQSPEAGGYTPSDFPLANLDQQAISKVLGAVAFEE